MRRLFHTSWPSPHPSRAGHAPCPQTQGMRIPSRSLRIMLAIGIVVMSVCTSIGASPAAAAPSATHPRWAWPTVEARTVQNPYRAPAHAYGAGHRGIDLALAPGGAVVAPADGIVAFSGTVVDRPLVTVEHAGGYVSTFEPVQSPLRPGDAVSVGDTLGALSAGGHARASSLHLGVRLDGVYIDPMLLFGEAEPAVLLPCCHGPG